MLSFSLTLQSLKTVLTSSQRRILKERLRSGWEIPIANTEEGTGEPSGSDRVKTQGPQEPAEVGADYLPIADELTLCFAGSVTYYLRTLQISSNCRI